MKPQLLAACLVTFIFSGCALEIEHLSRIEGTYFKQWGSEEATRPYLVGTARQELVSEFRRKLEAAAIRKPFFGYSKTDRLDFLFKGKLHLATGLNYKIEIYNDGIAVVDVDDSYYVSKNKLDTRALRDFLEFLER
ncbi:MAG: hypothetical protein ACYS8W_02765 [Planctomycetota bacterium]|jgi:hypothetical protein